MLIRASAFMLLYFVSWLEELPPWLYLCSRPEGREAEAGISDQSQCMAGGGKGGKAMSLRAIVMVLGLFFAGGMRDALLSRDKKLFKRSFFLWAADMAVLCAMF